MTVHASTMLMQQFPWKGAGFRKIWTAKHVKACTSQQELMHMQEGNALNCRGAEAPAWRFLHSLLMHLFVYLVNCMLLDILRKLVSITILMFPWVLWGLSKLIKPKEEVMRAPNLSPIIRNFGGLDFFFYQYLSDSHSLWDQILCPCRKNSQNWSILENTQLVFSAQLLAGLLVGRNPHTHLGIMEMICSRLSQIASPQDMET